MRTRLGILACTVSLFSGLSHSGPAADVGAQGFVDPGHSHSAGEGVGQDQIIEAVQKRYNAKVVRVTETTFDGRPALQLRMLSAQRVWSIVVDARSGRVLSGG